MIIQVWLQNAWSHSYAGRVWPRESWLRALHASRSGQRLRDLTCSLLRAGHEIVYDNLTPEVGQHPGSLILPDVQHVLQRLSEVRPAVLVGCGFHAAKTLPVVWTAGLTLVPHPAARLLRASLYKRAARLLLEESDGRWQLAMARGRIGYKLLRLREENCHG